jgi:hypothetical protein
MLETSVILLKWWKFEESVLYIYEILKTTTCVMFVIYWVNMFTSHII